MLRTVAAIAVLGALLSGTVGRAQQGPPTTPQRLGFPVDSGFVDGAADLRTELVVGEVCVPGVAWLQLWFDACALPDGSRLRIEAVAPPDAAGRPAARQRFDARSLRDYGSVSAFFNGDRVRLVLAGAHPRLLSWRSPEDALSLLGTLAFPTDEPLDAVAGDFHREDVPSLPKHGGQLILASGVKVGE